MPVFDPFGFVFEVEQEKDWYGQRKQFRAQALTALRKREGLPGPVDETGTPLETRFDDRGGAYYCDAQGNKVEHVLFAGAGKDGKPGGFAVGTRKQESETVETHSKSGIAFMPTAEVARAWGGGSQFQILEVSEDGKKKLSDELADLDRDVSNFERFEKVSHGAESQMAPELVLDGTSDEEVDAKLQAYLKRGK